MIGHSVKLYDMVLQFLRTLFLRTKNIHYCTLRAELLMALHDLEVGAYDMYTYILLVIFISKIIVYDIVYYLNIISFIRYHFLICIYLSFFSLQIQDIISVDPCHKFTWCLDACIREKNVDVKRSRELQGFLDSIKVWY